MSSDEPGQGATRRAQRLLWLAAFLATLLAGLAVSWIFKGEVAPAPSSDLWMPDARVDPQPPDAETPANVGTPDAGGYCRSLDDLHDPLPGWVESQLVRVRALSDALLGLGRADLSEFLKRLPEWDLDEADRLRLSLARRQDGIDLFARALAFRAYRRQWDDQGNFCSEDAVLADAQDPLVAVVRGLVLEAHGRRREAWSPLRRAFELDPLNPQIALGLALRLRRSGNRDEALAALQVYRANSGHSDAQAQAAARLEEFLRAEADVGPYSQLEQDGVAVRWPAGKIPDAAARTVLDQILEALDETARLTETPRHRELTAVLYRSSAEMQAGLCGPRWAYGYFDGRSVLYVVYEAQEGAVREYAVRHETAHAQFRSAWPGWFSEGLADYVGYRGKLSPAKQARLRLLVQNQTWIPFASLNGPLSPFDDPDASLAYAQSDALVLFMLSEGGSDAIARAARILASPGDASKLLERVLGREVREEELLTFVRKELGAR